MTECDCVCVTCSMNSETPKKKHKTCTNYIDPCVPCRIKIVFLLIRNVFFFLFFESMKKLGSQKNFR